MRFPDPSLLVRIAIADAYAAAAEFVDPFTYPETFSDLLNWRGYQRHPTFGNAGRYTDDTEMSVANARVLIECDRPYQPIQFADAYVAEFAYGGRRRGYSRNLQTILEGAKTGEELLARLRPESRKNGAAMRAVPFGVLPTPDDAMRAATVQALVTHDTPEGRFSARLVALMSHFALYEDRPFAQIPEYCRAHLKREDVQFLWIFDRDWPKTRPVEAAPAASIGITTVYAAATAVMRERSLKGILERVIRCGGDTDSVAAIACGIASPRFQDEELPMFLERDLEAGNPKTGPARLRDISLRLMAKFA